MKSSATPGYRMLERKLFIRIAFIMAAALLVVLVLQSLASGYAGDFIVTIIQSVSGLPRDFALNFYQRNIRSNMAYILLGSVAVFFLVLSRFLLSRFSHYFTEIASCLDVLVGGDGAISLSAEMITMQNKLTAVKNTLEERQREASAAEKSKNDVVMYLAHDIKTPLTSVIGYLSLLHEALDMSAEQKTKYIGVALEKANRLEKLVDEFFEITRYSFQTNSPIRAPVDLYYMLAQMTDEFYPLLAAANKQIVVHAPEDLTVFGDADQLARVFNNVLKNAVAYSPKHSVIDISVSLSGDFVSIVIANPGCIPADKLDAVFDKFYRLDSARSPDTGGAGLGLAIAKEIVSSHGGRIYADSDGKQISITVLLPAMAGQP